MISSYTSHLLMRLSAFCECVAPLHPRVALPLMRYLPVVQCGQKASSEVQSVILEKGKIIKKEDCAHGDIWR